MPRDNGHNRRTANQSAVHRKSRKRRKKNNNSLIILGLGIIVVLAAVLGIIKLKGKVGDLFPKKTTEVSQEAENETDSAMTKGIRQNAVIDLSSVINDGSGIPDNMKIHVQGMTPAEISEAIASKYDWSLKIVNSDAKVGEIVKPKADINQTTEEATLGDAENPDSANNTEESSYSEISVNNKIDVPDYIAERIPAMIEQIVRDDEAWAAEQPETEPETTKKAKKSKETETEAETTESSAPEVVYTLALDDIDDEVAEIVKYASDMWYVEPLGGSIGSYDSQNDKFIMENSRNGFEVNKDQLLSDLRSAIAGKDYTADVKISGRVLDAENSDNVSGGYKVLATYTTNTTNNSVRNKNVSLACQKLNGTIVRPGEEFSFNKTVGQRTKEAGFGEAAAYNNGEVVQEVGGGVCQVSTTLYNAVLKAGLKITARQSHTFKPTYVTPGQDATVSWGGPDFRFANLPNKPEYSYNTTYAIGIRASYSNQVVTVSIYGRPVLKDGYTFSLNSSQTGTIPMVRQAIPVDGEKKPETGTTGSTWETRLVIKKGEEVISNNVDHSAKYAGHIEYYYEESESESLVDGEPGEISDDPVAEGPGGPGGQSTSPVPTTTVPATTAAQSHGDQNSEGPVTSTGNSAPQVSAPDNSPSGGASAPSSSNQAPGADNSPGSSSAPSGNAPGGEVTGGPVISSEGPSSMSGGAISNGPGM